MQIKSLADGFYHYILNVEYTGTDSLCNLFLATCCFSYFNSTCTSPQNKLLLLGLILDKFSCFNFILPINQYHAIVFDLCELIFKQKQVNENALLQQALAMSMDDPTINHDMRDTDMSEAAAEDPELALGEFLCLIILYLNMCGCFLIYVG